MDPINARFFKSLVRAIERRTSGPLQEQENSASKYQQSAENENGQPSPIEIRAELRLPVAIREYYEAKQRERQSWWPKIKAGLEIVGVAVALVLAGLTYVTLQKTSLQADSAQKQVAIMRSQLEATDRPWIKIVSAEQTAGIRFHRRVDNSRPMAYAPFTVRVKNVGRSVAVDVKMRSRLLFELPEDTNYSLRVRQNTICAQRTDLFMSPEFTLFPDEDSGERHSNSLDELIPDEARYPMPGKDLWVKPIIPGCITYRRNPSDTKIHHTGFLYEFVRKGDTNRSLFNFSQSRTVSELSIEEHSFGFSYAD